MLAAGKKTAISIFLDNLSLSLIFLSLIEIYLFNQSKNDEHSLNKQKVFSLIDKEG